MADNYNDIINEVLNEIEASLQDPKGMALHQRRLAFVLSLRAVAIIEHYLNSENVFKKGSKINHLWLKKKKENVKALISNVITCPVERLNDIDKLLDYAFQIENERNELAYGKNTSEQILKEKINLFFDMKKVVNND